ncbi:MAG: sulfotransferase [Cytophagaceae bacterium]
MSRVVILLGMHRSGTSLIANWMHHCDIKLGDNYYTGTIGNEDGHYEDIDFLNLHEEIFLSYNLDPSGLKSWKLPSEIDETHFNKIKHLIDKKNKLHNEWGWKEPRTCMYLQYYRELLPDAKYLIILREPAQVVDSLLRRDLLVLKLHFQQNHPWKYKTFSILYWWYKVQIAKQTEEIYLQAWIAYNEKVVEHLSSIDKNQRMILCFDQVQSNQNSIFDFMENAGFKIKRQDFQTVFKPKMIKKKKMKLSYSSSLLIKKANQIYNNLLEKSSF